MPTLETIFVVVDPTTDQQPALHSAAAIAGGNEGAHIHAYAAVYNGADTNDWEALKRVELGRHEVWLEGLVEPLRAAGLNVSVEADWTSEWRDAIGPAAKRAGASLVVKAAQEHSKAGRRILKTSDWSLLRTSPCPVYLVKQEELRREANVLVAVDITREDDLHKLLNEMVLEFGRAIVENVPGATMHAVNAYSDSSHFVHPPDVAKFTGVERDKAHTADGAPEKVIPEIAESIDADIVVIGTAARAGISAAVLGNTAEKILDAVQTNTLTVTPPSA